MIIHYIKNSKSKLQNLFIIKEGTSMSLTKNIVSVLKVNVLKLVLTALVTLIMPAFLSINTYADIKMFQLYVSYIGLFHFGYVDGIYMKYGGSSINVISQKEFKNALSTFRGFELFIAGIIMIISVILKNKVLFFFSIVILPLNMSSFFQMFYTAIGEFKKYSSIVAFSATLTSIVQLAFITIYHIDISECYLIAFVCIDYLVWIILEISLYKKDVFRFKLSCFDFKELYRNIKQGILLTLANLSSYIFTGLDRWFIKFLLTITDFAQYSFAVTLESFVSVLLTPISITLYNFFCSEKSLQKIVKLRKYVTLIGAIIIASVFPLKIIIYFFIPEYAGSIKVIYYLFSTQLFYFPIKCIYVNLYKARKQQKKYFKTLILAIIAGVVFNIICYSILKNKEAFAIGTVIAAVIWWSICMYDFKEIRYGLKELLFVFIIFFIYYSCENISSPVIGLTVYVVSYFCLSYLLMKEEVISFIYKIKKYNINSAR